MLNKDICTTETMLLLLLLKSVQKDDDVALPLDVRTYQTCVFEDDFVVGDPTHRFCCSAGFADAALRSARRYNVAEIQSLMM